MRWTLLAITAVTAGCGGAPSAGGPPAPGPFLVTWAQIDEGLRSAGIAFSERPTTALRTTTAPWAEGARRYRTSAGTRMTIFRYRSADVALRASAAIRGDRRHGVHLRHNVLGVITAAGPDSTRVRRAILRLGADR